MFLPGNDKGKIRTGIAWNLFKPANNINLPKSMKWGMHQ